MGRSATWLGAIVLAAVALTACSPGTMNHGTTGHAMGGPGAGFPPGDPAATGGGGVTSFKLSCRPAHVATDDPIVHPGHPGAAHLHQFFGNTATDAFSAPATLVDGPATTCTEGGDRSGYWVPVLYQSGVAVTPRTTQIYYRGGSHRDATKIQPLPAGLRMVIGKADTTAALPTSVVHFKCGAEGLELATPPTCATLPLWLTVNFPDCWDGRHLDSTDHYSHMAYTTRGFCPETHPVPVPQIELNVVYRTAGGQGTTLSSGRAITAHADFMNGWNQTRQRGLVVFCLHQELRCFEP